MTQVSEENTRVLWTWTTWKWKGFSCNLGELFRKDSGINRETTRADLAMSLLPAVQRASQLFDLFLDTTATHRKCFCYGNYSPSRSCETRENFSWHLPLISKETHSLNKTYWRHEHCAKEFEHAGMFLVSQQIDNHDSKLPWYGSQGDPFNLSWKKFEEVCWNSDPTFTCRRQLRYEFEAKHTKSLEKLLQNKFSCLTNG